MSSVALCFRVRRVVLIASAALAFPAMVGAATIKVCASGCPYSNLQSAINAAQPGDTLLLRAGETFVGNFILPAKTTSSTAFITIRSDAADSVLPGPATRLVPSGRSGANTSRTLLPRLLGAGGTAKTVPVIRTLPGAHHFRLEFLEVDGAAQLGYETLIAVGTDKADTPPHDIVFDRIYVHGHATKGQKRGIALNGGSTDVLNSYIADIKSANYDSQALAGWNGAGPYRIANNYIEAAGENVMFGGSLPAKSGLIPSDIVITGNDIAKVTAWRNPILAAPGSPKAAASSATGSLSAGKHYFRIVAVTPSADGELVSLPSVEVSVTATSGHAVALSWSASAGADKYRIYRGTTAGGEAKYITTSGSTASFVYTGAAESTGKPRTSATHWIAKNLLEFKNAQRVTIDGNRFENNWSGDQPGFAVVLTPRNVAGKMPWSAVRDITFTNNIVRHTAAAVNILGYDGTQAAGSQITSRISIRNNLLYDITPAKWGSNQPACFQIGQGATDVTIDGNTIDHATTTLLAAYGKPMVRFVFTNNIARYGTYGVMGSGSSAGNPTLAKYFPGAIFKYNVLAGGTASLYPATNMFPTIAQWDASFVNAPAGDYHLRSSSVFFHAGSGGSTPGVNVDVLMSSDDITVDPQPPPPPPSGQAPTAEAGGPYTATAKQDLSVTGAASTNGSSTISTYAWQWGDEVVLDASDAAPVDVHGKWQKATMPGTAAGVALVIPDANAKKAAAPLASPSSYVDLHFYAASGVPYYIWFRAQAERNLYTNDSFYMQFSDAVDAAGKSQARIGTTAGLAMVLEEGSGAGLSGWGWNDANYGGPASPVYFASSGPHTLRLQVREDGIQIDQIVISSAAYANKRPGVTRTDTTIVPGTLGLTTGVSAIHRYAVAGVYPVVLTVVDVAGLRDTDTATATVK